MSVCPHCGQANTEDQALCAYCGRPLSAEGIVAEADDPSKRDTGVLEAVDSRGGTVHWGTASLGAERKLLLHVRGFDDPMVATLSEMLVIGRFDPDTGRTPDINLDPYAAKDMGVSRRHAAVFLEDDGLKVVDLGSANKSYINGQRLVAHQERVLRDGDELRLGRLIIRIAFA